MRVGQCLIFGGWNYFAQAHSFAAPRVEGLGDLCPGQRVGTGSTVALYCFEVWPVI